MPLARLQLVMIFTRRSSRAIVDRLATIDGGNVRAIDLRVIVTLEIDRDAQRLLLTRTEITPCKLDAATLGEIDRLWSDTLASAAHQQAIATFYVESMDGKRSIALRVPPFAAGERAGDQCVESIDEAIALFIAASESGTRSA